MSLVLLIGASLFVRSFLNLRNALVGYDTSPRLTLRFYLPGVVYEPADATVQRVQDIVWRVQGFPGVGRSELRVSLGAGAFGVARFARARFSTT